jgi:hypothetical protein
METGTGTGRDGRGGAAVATAFLLSLERNFKLDDWVFLDENETESGGGWTEYCSILETKRRLCAQTGPAQSLELPGMQTVWGAGKPLSTITSLLYLSLSLDNREREEEEGGGGGGGGKRKEERVGATEEREEREEGEGRNGCGRYVFNVACGPSQQRRTSHVLPLPDRDTQLIAYLHPSSTCPPCPPNH